MDIIIKIHPDTSYNWQLLNSVISVEFVTLSHFLEELRRLRDTCYRRDQRTSVKVFINCLQVSRNISFQDNLHVFETIITERIWYQLKLS
jgi:hypothetical protein